MEKCPSFESRRWRDSVFLTYGKFLQKMAGAVFLLRLLQTLQSQVLFPVVVSDIAGLKPLGFLPVKDIANAAMKGVVGFGEMDDSRSARQQFKRRKADQTVVDVKPDGFDVGIGQPQKTFEGLVFEPGLRRGVRVSSRRSRRRSLA